MLLLFMKERNNQSMKFVINAFKSVRFVVISKANDLEKHGSSFMVERINLNSKSKNL
jgi:hypothetical protein